MEPTNIFQIQCKQYPKAEFLEILPCGENIGFKNFDKELILKILLEDVIGLDQLTDETLQINLFTRNEEVVSHKKRCC